MNNSTSPSIHSVSELFTTKCIRERAEKIFQLAVSGKTHFQYHPEKMPELVDFVHQVILKNYPDLKIPFHSRWGHFRAGRIDRQEWLREKYNQLNPTPDRAEFMRVQYDLVIPSVLLDAGAGAAWKYAEKSHNTNLQIGRSEGLGLASFHWFMDGGFSSSGKDLKTEASALQKITEKDLEKAFQVSAQNPLVGVSGRVILMKNLGKAIADQPEYFKDGRPGGLIDYILQHHKKSIKATELLSLVLKSLGRIWPSRSQLDGVSLGDAWKYSGFNRAGATEAEMYMPFHKLSQWLTYSLMEPLIAGGIEVTDLNDMTGLPEYRNGGLIVDLGLVTLRDQSLMAKDHAADSDLVIEWRALTVYLLDQIAKELQKKMNITPEQFPLVKVLEGGTWWAGRAAAAAKRSNGNPPLNIISDGTVF